MSENNLDIFKQLCSNIINNTPAEYKWQWDDRFNVALVVFEKKDIEKIFSTVINEFMAKWEAKTIAKASKFIRKLVKSIFDIKPGQVIFTSDEKLSAVLLAAWWPWDNGSNVSLRIGIYPVNKDEVDEEELIVNLKDWFNLK